MGPTTFAIPDVVGVDIVPIIRYCLLSSTTESLPAIGMWDSPGSDRPLE